jgi:N-acyl-D-amino-acid deacylase
MLAGSFRASSGLWYNENISFLPGLREGFVMFYDLVIKNGNIIDPLLELTTIGNIGVHSGKIVTITRETIEGTTTIDAKMQVVSPGFVDIHSHVDNYQCAGKSYALQGITTTIGGNCGLSPLSPTVFFEQMQKTGFPINQGQFAGHSFSLREEVGLTNPHQPADKEQIEMMVELAQKRLAQGAIGISFGLEYAPGSSYQEVLELCRLAALYGKPVSIHVRHDSWEGLKAIDETIRLAEETGVSIIISHLVYMVGMGMMTEALCMIDNARERGLDIAVDSGLYSAFATFIGSEVFAPGCLEKWGRSYEDLYISTGPYAHQQCTEPLFNMLRKEAPETVLVAFVGTEAEVYEALARPYVVVSTDGAVGSPEPGTGHPQDSGTYPKFFRTMVRETGRLSLLEAVRKCTLQPARLLGLDSKGTIKPGSDADLVIFDLNRISDTSDYPGLGQPDSPPLGIDYVIVNGQLVVENGEFIATAKPGLPVAVPNSYWCIS